MLDDKVKLSSPAGSHRLFVELGTDLLQSGHGISFRAAGRSMFPAIRNGEKIRVEPVQPSAVKRGDIILYSTHKSVLAHRVRRITRKAQKASRFLLRGDACVTFDGPVEPSQVLGNVVWVERGSRRIMLNSWWSRTCRLARVPAVGVRKWLVSARELLWSVLPS